MNTVIPLMIADVDFAMRSWGNTGQFDTFDKIYNVSEHLPSDLAY